MRGQGAPAHPRARTDELIVRELHDEVLVYDLARDKAHCLNQTAALVWRHCDGLTSVAELARVLSRETDAPVDERVVWLALKQLSRDRLLEAGAIPPQPGGLNRRQMMRVLGRAAVVALPLVTTIVAPTPAQASYALPSGACCDQSDQCQSGICSSSAACDSSTGKACA
ncbi:MAG: PqqD family protein [Pyrinomonadaceae bacterium]